MGHWMFSFVYHPPNPPLSELFPCLAGMQLNQRATCALRCPECLSGGLSHCENEQNQRRNICVSLERERIRRPKKNVTILALGIWLCTSRHPFCLMQDRAISTGKPSQTWSPFQSWGGQDAVLLLATSCLFPEGGGIGLDSPPLEHNSALWPLRQKICNPFRGREESHPAHGS